MINFVNGHQPSELPDTNFIESLGPGDRWQFISAHNNDTKHNDTRQNDIMKVEWEKVIIIAS